MVKGILVNRKSDDNLKNQMKMEHADLIAEMQTVENLPTPERLQLARLRRAQQLKVARQKEKEWLKMQRAKGNPLPLLNSSGPGPRITTRHSKNSNNYESNRRIAFESSVVLLEAASRNDMQEVAELLEKGITPDAANEDGLTALHQCCIDNNVEMLKLLLEYGANVDAQDSDKWTPLHAAATCGHLELVHILIDHGANLLAVNTDGNMPYDLCDDENTLDYIEAEMSKRGVTQELIDDTRSATEKRMLKDLMEIANCGGDLEEPDNQGATPLHIAAANGYVSVVEFLLEMHVNVDALDKDLWSPVHAAACWGHLEVLEMLATCGADLNIKNKDDETPSDISDDPEIRERIEQLKTEQESKRLAEAQRRRVRRSQSSNTRAQSVRRTSLRDKTLTTKKDAVEEARLRLQAQEGLIAPESTTIDPKGINGALNADAVDTSTVLMGGPQSGTASSILTSDYITSHSNSARRPPDGRENDELHLNHMKMNSMGGTNGESVSTASVILSEHNLGSSLASEAVQIQSSKEAGNGKINVQVTVLVGANTNSNPIAHTNPHSNPIPTSNTNTNANSSAAINGLGYSHGHSTAAPAILAPHNGSTASLPSSALSSLANTGATPTVATNYNGYAVNNHNNNSHNNHTNSISNNNNSLLMNSHNDVALSNNMMLNSSMIHCDPAGLNPSGGSIDFNGLMAGAGVGPGGSDGNIVGSLEYGDTADVLNNGDMSAYAGVSKFSGITGDVVSDSTSSKRCCTLM